MRAIYDSLIMMNPHLKGFILAWPLVGALGWILHFLT